MKTKLNLGKHLVSLFIFSLFVISCANIGGNSPEVDDSITADHVIVGSKLNENAWAYYSEPLKVSNGTAEVSVSANMLVTNAGKDDVTLMWQVNVSDYPVIASQTFKPGTSEWVTVSGKEEIDLGSSNVVYLSTYGTTPKKLIIYLSDVSISASLSEVKDETPEDDDSDVDITTRPKIIWTSSSVPSLYETYKDYFDYFGLAVEHGLAGYSETEFATEKIQKGVKKHANTITMGNEFKPQFIMQLWGGNATPKGKFKASNGEEIDTFDLNFTTADAILTKCKNNGLKMRGHVLVWHSQTDEAFFREGYKKDGKLVNTKTMTARQEWYIKTVLEHVAKWEQENNDGKHIIWAWDVVNEAVADGSSDLRSDSNWYKIYTGYEFITNAFKFANQYAPKDVLLCYNDYNCLDATKRKGMLTVIDNIQATEGTRLDAMGMQSHISVNNTAKEFEKAVKEFLAKNIDVQVTELDMATETKYDPEDLAKKYKALFKMLIANRKTAEAKGVTAVTIWGINDESTWLNSESQIKYHGNVTQYPLLFEKEKNDIVTKLAFWGVYEAATE